MSVNEFTTGELVEFKGSKKRYNCKHQKKSDF